MPPVSVCHQVSTTGHRPPPMCSQYQIHASGLMGSPTEPSRSSDERSCLAGVVVAPLHEGSDGGGRRVELRDLVLLDDLPQAIVAGVVRDAFVDHAGRAVGQRSVDDVAVAGDPADVGRAPVHVRVLVEVEHVLVGERHLRQVATGGVHDALGLAGRPRRVEEVEQLLGVHGLGRALGLGVGHELVVPVVPALLHVDRVPAPSHHDDAGDAGRALDGDVGLGLEREDLAPAVAAVGGDEDLGLRVVDAVGEGRRREAAEDDAVRCADASAGQHGDDGLGDHRQVDVDPVAPLDPLGLQDVGEALHIRQQLGVGDDPAVARLTLPVEGHLVAPPGRDVAVQAVLGHVEPAADEPLGVGQVPLADGVPLLRPVHERGRLPGPEALVVGRGLVVQEGAGDQRRLLEALRRGKGAVLEQQVVDGPRRLVGHVRAPPGCAARTAGI